MAAEVRDVVTGLWLWRVPHPAWEPSRDWEQLVASTCVESGGEVVLLDPLAPPEGDEVWDRLDTRPPTMVVVLKPDHVRDVDLFVRRYGARAFGPWLFWRGDAPDTELEPVEPAATFPAASSRCTTAEAGTRPRSGFPSSARWSSRTR